MKRHIPTIIPTLTHLESDNTNLYDYLDQTRIKYWNVWELFTKYSVPSHYNNAYYSVSNVQYYLKESLQNENF